MSRKVPFSLYLTAEQHMQLKALQSVTRIPMSELIRGALDDMLAKEDNIEDNNGEKEILGRPE
ncbi:hypothetical protein LCGC14_0883450 [marine sediment metagenome]|uniref:Predicted DNA-binding protein ribbon-helix-helix domain-containing protein n=1 Tax=marine sediment metagenome TaxID=412755 RepID=A0A0F9RKQ1_9ZZZZ